ncbi:MAG: hypothetical protein HQ521_12290 [Bacteroidetes bacterium]|nr:hypothetical protein [Bacteroidota bacterium]
MGVKLLLVVLPYLVKYGGDSKKKSVRSFLAFPYGVLTIASYIKKYSVCNPDVRILDMNIHYDIGILEKYNEVLRI